MGISSPKQQHYTCIFALRGGVLYWEYAGLSAIKHWQCPASSFNKVHADEDEYAGSALDGLPGNYSIGSPRFSLSFHHLTAKGDLPGDAPMQPN